MSGDAPSSGNAGPNSPEYQRSATVASQWPADVDLDGLYVSERNEVDELVRSAADMSVWALENRKDNALVYLHSKNSERLSYCVRSVTKVAGSVSDVLECLRSPDNSSFRGFQKLLHSRNFLDGEVLHGHRVDSLTADGPTAEMHGNVGVCKFESYDGAAARYGIRGKPDAYSLTVFEPSSYVVQQTPEDPGMVSVTLTFAMRKARGGESISAGVRLTSMRLAGDLSGMQKAVQQAMFAPAALAQRQEWVNDAQRTNCSLCVQSFGMLKRRHHCRVCGEVVCSACTVFKLVKGDLDVATKVRVCKACLAKSGTNSNGNTGVGNPNFGSTMVGGFSNPPPARVVTNNGTELEMNGTGTTPIPHNGLGIGTSIGSTSSLTSDESHSPPNENPAAVIPPMMYNKGSALSLNDFEATHATDDGGSPPPYHKQSSGGSGRTTGGYEGRPIGTMGRTASNASIATSRKKNSERRIHYFNEDLEEICMLAMETLTCPMAGIRTEDFELVRYYDGKPAPGLPRSLPTFRRLATRGKPCIVLDVSSDKRISGDKRFTAKLQFFVGIPLLVNGEVVGDLCVADRYARDNIDHKQVEVLNVLGETVTQYMQSEEYNEDLIEFKASQIARKPPTGGPAPSQTSEDDGAAPPASAKEVAF
ncbi:hypothetical protein BBJ29_007504 [Phytophthora kernoviae]|uniref:FYVE-type domain-containing protein n=1 Tax=Phytophthora kernoviae TaxID=325452 RepID=A0A3F2RFQ8_9STRA|nr:hypothetical protein BBJ29_007504 [Phytophthora kernoviae]RLN55847.1 hypothetical protein BBP00_00008309 [Phytophthora kernoviae]